MVISLMTRVEKHEDFNGLLLLLLLLLRIEDVDINNGTLEPLRLSLTRRSPSRASVQRPIFFAVPRSSIC